MRQTYNTVNLGKTSYVLRAETVPRQLSGLFLWKLVDVCLCGRIAHIDSHLKQVPELIELPEFPLREGGVLTVANASRCFDEILHT